jgi:hypothetical protein
VTLFLLRHLWTLLLHLSLLHTRFGQYIERAYLRAALPTVRAFEIEELPVTGLGVPEDELVECGPEMWLDQSGNGNDLVASFNDIGFPIFRAVSGPPVRSMLIRSQEELELHFGGDPPVPGTLLRDGDPYANLICRTCHKPVPGENCGLCEACAFDELRERRGA